MDIVDDDIYELSEIFTIDASAKILGHRDSEATVQITIEDDDGENIL